MFFDRTFQIQKIHDDEKSMKYLKMFDQLSKEKSFNRKIFDKTKAYIKVFLETSTIHGFNHIVAPRRHFFESLIWLSLIALSVFGSIYLSKTTWTRYQYSPTVVSMDRDMYAWNTTFPVLTICPDKKISDLKLDMYLEASSEQNKTKLKNFITYLAKATYENFNIMPDYDGIPSDKYLELLLNLSAEFKPLFTIGASGVNLDLEPILTEMGLCYSINSKIAAYMSPDYIMQNRWDILKTHIQIFYVHPLDGEVFAQLINMSTAYDAYIHGPLEIPDISTKRQHSEENFYMKLFVTALSVYTSPEAAKLTIAQRKCRFFHENDLKHSAVYSYNVCRMECRIRLCLQYCKCVPHFYRRIGDEKVCDVNGLRCLGKYRDELKQILDKNKKKLNCSCMPNCDDVNYIMQSNALEKWTFGTDLQWGILTYPRMRYRRDILFGFTDVLVAVGGMAGLFLGCSVLSFMEIIYFLTLRLICYTRDNIDK